MEIVDSHCHVGAIWYEPVETLRAVMDRAGVAKAVLVQMLGQVDNSYQQDCAARDPARFASVIGLDAAAPDAAAHLARAAEQSAAGVRLRPQAASGDALSIWRAAARLKLPVSCVGTAESFTAPAFLDVLKACPDLPIVLEHFGATSAPDRTDAERAARRAVFALARFPNLSLKLPGLGELAPRRADFARAPHVFEDGADALIHEALTAFGPARLMWGSDFPVVASREGYANALAGPRRVLAQLSDSEQAAIFGGNAARVFFRQQEGGAR